MINQATLKLIILTFKKGKKTAVPWLELGAFTAVAQVQSLVRDLRSCKSRCMAKKKGVGGKKKEDICNIYWKKNAYV